MDKPRYRLAPLEQFVEDCIHVTGAVEQKFDDWGFQCLVFGYVVGRDQALRTHRPLRRVLEQYYRMWDARPFEATKFILNALTGFARGRGWAR